MKWLAEVAVKVLLALAAIFAAIRYGEKQEASQHAENDKEALQDDAKADAVYRDLNIPDAIERMRKKVRG